MKPKELPLMLTPHAYDLSDHIGEVQRLYDQGLFLQAWNLASDLGDPLKWPTTKDQVLGGRLLSQTGDFRQGRRTVLRAWQHNPSDPLARHHVLWVVRELRGAYAALTRQRQWWQTEEASLSVRVDQEAMAGYFLGQLRDFSRAQVHFERALTLNADDTWARLLWGEVFLIQDDFLPALRAAQDVLGKRPHYWAAAGLAARAWVALGDDERALEVLHAASSGQESLGLCSQLIELQIEVGDCRGARLTLARALEVAPNLSGDLLHWWQAKQHHCAYELADWPQARAWAAKLDHAPEYRELEQRLANFTLIRPPGVTLSIPFVRQHHLTCVPATLTAIAAFFGKSIDHLQVTDEICYDGTSHHSERAWAERQGWLCREFRVTWDSAKALIDRQIPFALSSVMPGSAHMQAVMGYDELRRTLLIRDPSYRSKQQIVVDPFLHDQAAYGPRGHVILPAEHAEKLAGLDLPDADLFDLYHAFFTALDRHQRADADAFLHELIERAPHHHLALTGRRALASYDRHPSQQLAAIRIQRELFPDDVHFILIEVSVLRQLGHEQEAQALLAKVCTAPDAHPLLRLELALGLLPDGREFVDAQHQMRQVMRSMCSAKVLHGYARALWLQGRRHDALECFRLASCLDAKNENFAESYVYAAQSLHARQEVLAHLRWRVEDARQRSTAPVQTLVQTLVDFDEITAAHLELERALSEHPDDGNLHLFAFGLALTWNQLDRAADLLNRAKPSISRFACTWAQAKLLRRQGELAQALAMCQELVRLEPLNMDANAAVADLLGQTKGRQAALAWLAEVCTRFDHFLPLLQLHAQWLRDEGIVDQIAVLQHMVATHPNDAWTRRELALAYLRQRRVPAAHEQARQAIALEPHQAASHTVLAHVLVEQRDVGKAREHYRRALALAVDQPQALCSLIEQAHDEQSRSDELAFARDLIFSQSFDGTAIETFVQVARPFLPPSELLSFVRQATQRRPDLVLAWCAQVSEEMACGELDSALASAQAMLMRFGHLARAHVSLAQVLQARGDQQGRVAALQRATQLEPRDGWTARELSAALCDAHDWRGAESVMVGALRHQSLDAWNHWTLARVLWHLGRRQEALSACGTALELEPHVEQWWLYYRAWGEELGQPDLALERARELARLRPGEAQSWALLAKNLHKPEQSQARIEALQHAVDLSPHVSGYRLELCRAHVAREQWEQALAVCQTPACIGRAASELNMIRAWALRKKGDHAAAVAAMHDALAREPTIIWAWQERIEWATEDGDWLQAEEAAAMLQRLQPGEAMPFVYAADVKLARGDKAGAKANYAQALALQPGYFYAALHLYDLELEVGDDGAARQALAGLAVTHEATVAARHWELAERKGDAQASVSAFCHLMRSSDDHAEAFSYVYQRLPHGKNQLVFWLKHCQSLIASGSELNPNFGWFWVGMLEKCGRLTDARELQGLHGSPAAKSAFRAHMEALADRALALQWLVLRSIQRWSYRRNLRRCLRECTWARSDDACWGKATYALVTLGDFASAGPWFAGWQARRNIEPWMWINLVVGYHRRNELAQAVQVVEHARAFHMRGDANSHWLACYDALHGVMAGDLSRLSNSPSNAAIQVEQGYSRALFDFVDMLASALKPVEYSFHFDAHNRRVVEVWHEQTKGDKVMRRALSMAIRMIARETQSLKPILWYEIVLRLRRMLRIVGTALWVMCLSSLLVRLLRML